MASQNDLILKAVLDVAGFVKGLDEMLAQAKAKGKLIADALGKASTDSTRPTTARPATAPSPASPGGGAAPRPTRPPGPDPNDDEARRLAAALKAQQTLEEAERRHAAINRAISEQTTDALIDDILRLREKKKALKAAELAETDKAAKAELVSQRKVIEEEIGLRSAAASQRKEVIEDGAGVRAGILGKKRNVDGAGAFGFNQGIEAAQNISDLVSDLSAPLVALDEATAKMRAIGDEAAAMSEELAGAALDSMRNVPFEAAEIMEAYNGAIAAGVKGGADAIATFGESSGKLATVAGSEIGTAGDVLSGVLNSYGLDASKATTISDQLWNTINAGVLSMDEMKASFANVLPTASAMNLSFDSLGGAMAALTQKNIPFAQATTKLNALLLEVQKPGTSLAPILKQAGVGAEELAQNFPAALAKIDTALRASGKTAVQAFSSSEASAAFNVFAKDLAGLQKSIADVGGAEGVGTVDKSFGEMADSISVKTKLMLNSVQSFLAEGVSKLGTGVLSIAGVGSQLAPTISTLAGLKGLGLGTVFDGLKKAVGENGGGIVGAFRALGAGASGVGSTIATLGQSLGTVLLGPVGIVLALAAGFYALYQNVNEVKAAVDGLVSGIGAIIGGAGDIFGALLEGGPIAAFTKAGQLAGEAFATEYKATLSAADLEDALEDLADAQAAALEGKGKADAAKGLDDLVAKYNKATTDVEKNAIAEKIAEGFPSAVQSVEVFNEKTGEVERRLSLSVDRAKELSAAMKADGAEGIADAQEDAVKGLQAQLQVLKQQDAAVDQLKEKLAAQKAQGIDTSETQTQLDEAKKAAEKARADIAQTLQIGKDTGIFQNLPPELDKVMKGMEDGLKPVVAKMESDAANSRIGETLGKAASLQGNLDTNDALGGLVEKFKNAKTEAEKNSIAAAIASQVPQAVSQYDEMGNAIAINADKVAEFAEAQKKGFGGDQSALREKFSSDLKSQADQLANTRDQIGTLTAKIIEYDKTGKDASGLRAELEQTKTRADEQAAALGNNIQQGKKFGLISGDVKNVGKEFGFTTRQTVSAAQGVSKIKEQTEGAQGAAADLAAEFANMRSTIDKSVQDNLAKVALVRVKEALREEITDQEREEAAAAAEALKVAVSRQKTFNKEFENLQIQYGLKERERKEKQRRDTSGLDSKLRVEQLKEQQRLAAIESDFLRNIAKAQGDIRLKRLEQKNKIANLEADIAASSDDAEKRRLRNDIIRLQAAGGEFEQEIALLNQTLSQTIEDGKKGLANDVLGVVDAIEKGAIEVQAAINDALTPVEGSADLATVKKQGEGRIALITRNANLEAAALVAGSNEFNERARAATESQTNTLAETNRKYAEALEAYNDKRAELAKGGLSGDALESAIRGTDQSRALDDATTKFKDASADLTKAFGEERAKFLAQFSNLDDAAIEALGATSPELQRIALQLRAIRVKSERETAVAESEERKRQRAAELTERLKGVESLVDQEKLIALAAIDDRLDEELIKHKGNDAQITAAKAQAAKDRLKIEREYARQTNITLDLSLRFAESLLKASLDRQKGLRDADRQKKLDELRKEEADLLASLNRREITITEYGNRRVDIEKQRQEAMVDGDRRTNNVAENVYHGMLDALSGMREGFEDRQSESMTKFAEETGTAIADGGLTTAESLKAAGDVGINAIGAMFGKFADMAATGRATFGDFADAFMLSMIDMVESAIAANIVNIYTFAIAELGFVGGLAAATGAIALFLGLAEAAKGDIRARLGKKGFAKGVVALDGPGTATSDSIDARLSRGESVLTARATAAGANAERFRWANRTGRDLADFPGDRASVAPVPKPELSRLVYDVTLGVVRPVVDAVVAQNVALTQRVAALESQTQRPASRPSKPAAPVTNVRVFVDGEEARGARILRR